MIELKNEIPEEIEKLRKLNNLPPCVHDGEIMQNFAKVLKVASENIVVMATEADAIQIMKTKDMQSRRDPTLKNYIEALKEFVGKAKLNPDKNYL